ncbi:MAG: hypothetical protein LH679_12715 [Cyanobacteria bacterium CAN_BIN43]|nr:hypothetical protein [Cyanobacteria bacterium CAN_BIN43]
MTGGDVFYYKPKLLTSDKNIVLQTLEFAPSLDARSPQKSHSNASLLPADPIGARFCQWFNHRWDFIYAPLPAKEEKTEWLTERRYPLELRTLWRVHQDPNELIGLRFGNQTRYCLIDIDRGSEYHPANNSSKFKDVLAALENIGLCRSIFITSSSSDGIHVYYFLPELLPTFGLASAIKFALEDTGLQLRCGQLESFPNVKVYSKHGKSLYNACRLPLQVGSYFLDDDAQPLTDDLTQFLNAADVAATHQDLTALKKAITAAKKRPKRKHLASVSDDVHKRSREIQELIAQGWTGSGQTNDLLIKIANDAVFWKDLHGEALVDHIEATAIALPGYKQHCRHQHEIRKRAAEVAKMADGYWTPYCSYPERSGRSYQANFGQQNNIVKFPANQANVESSQQAAKRIQQAVDHLKITAMLPAGVTARVAAIKVTYEKLFSKVISLETLYRPCHKSLWHPGYQELLEPAQGETLRAVLDTDSDQGSLKPAQGETLRAVSPNEVSACEVCLPETPQRVSEEVEEVFVLVQEGECEGEFLPTALSQTLQLVAAAAPTISEQPVAPTLTSPIPVADDPKTTRRLIRIFLDANNRAEKAVKQQQSLSQKRLSYEERSRLLTAAKMRFLWESGEPLWIDEVKKWATADPSIFPEALPQPAESASEFLPLEVGDRIWWDNCPGHCYSMNPFTIIAINGEMASLDVYSKPVLMSQLRRWAVDF